MCFTCCSANFAQCVFYFLLNMNDKGLFCVTMQGVGYAIGYLVISLPRGNDIAECLDFLRDIVAAAVRCCYAV